MVELLLNEDMLRLPKDFPDVGLLFTYFYLMLDGT